MSITIQHVQVHLDNLQAEASFDDRDASGRIVRHGQIQFTLSVEVRDALLAESGAAIAAAVASVAPANLNALFAARDEALAEKATLDEEIVSKQKALSALAEALPVDVASAVPAKV